MFFIRSLISRSRCSLRVAVTTFIIRRLGWPGLQERPAAQRPGLAVAGDLGHDKDTGTRTDWRLPRLAGMRPEADLGNVNVSPAQSAATTAL